jgi:hypothetical protein
MVRDKLHLNIKLLPSIKLKPNQMVKSKKEHPKLE